MSSIPPHATDARHVDSEISRIAGQQHGVVTTAQLHALGLIHTGIAWRVRVGRLHRVHRGVYVVGHVAISDRTRWMAAVLAAGDGAALAGLAAANLHRMSRIPARRIEVVVPRSRRPRSDPPVRRSRTASAGDQTTRDRITTTTVARTLVDVSDELTEFQVANLMHEAAFRAVLRVPRLEACIASNARRRGPGPRIVRRALELHLGGSAGTRSALEDRVLERVLAGGLPEPLVNVHVQLPDGTSLEVDEHWPDRGVVLEVDGSSGHARRATRIEDQARDTRLRAAGWRVVRVGELELDTAWDDVLAGLCSALRG